METKITEQGKSILLGKYEKIKCIPSNLFTGKDWVDFDNFCRYETNSKTH